MENDSDVDTDILNITDGNQVDVSDNQSHPNDQIDPSMTCARVRVFVNHKKGINPRIKC